jgi:hypothetical protein
VKTQNSGNNNALSNMSAGRKNNQALNINENSTRVIENKDEIVGSNKSDIQKQEDELESGVKTHQVN